MSEWEGRWEETKEKPNHDWVGNVPKWNLIAAGADWVTMTESEICWPGRRGLLGDPGEVPVGDEVGAMVAGAAHFTVTVLEVRMEAGADGLAGVV